MICFPLIVPSLMLQLSAKAQALLDETLGKSLSSKAKALLDQTLGKSLSAKAQALFNETTGKSKGDDDQRNESGGEDAENPPQASFDGYEGSFNLFFFRSIC